MADKETPSKKASDDAPKDKVLKVDSQTKKKNRISGMFNFLKKKDKEDSSDHKGGEAADAQTLAHFAESENGADSGPNSSTIKNGSDADDKKKKADQKKDDDKKEKKKEKSGHRKIKSSYDGKTRDPLADSEDPEKKKKKEKEKNKTKDKKDKKDKKKDKKEEPETTTEVTQTETVEDKEEKEDTNKQLQDFADLQKQAAEVEDLVAAYQTHDTRTQEQKYRTLSRQKSYKEKWGQRTISSKSIRMVQVERKVVYDLFTAPAQNQPAKSQSAASTPRVEVTITKAPTPAQEISVDLPKETAEPSTATETSALKKRALPRRGANKPATKFDMVQKFNQKLSKQAGAEEVEIEAPQPENITIDDKPVEDKRPTIDDKPAVAVEQDKRPVLEPLKLEVTEEVVVLQVTPREHYKETEPDAKPEVKPTTPAVEVTSPVKQVEPKKEDVKPVETKPTITVTTPAVQTKPAATTAPATSSPLDQFFQAGESRKEKERIEQEKKVKDQKEVLANAKKWDRERDNKETAKMYKVAVKKAQEQVHRVRLMHCKGKRRVWVREVEVSAKSLNEGDAFVLDLDKVIYVWNGAKANAVEKSKAVGIATMIRDHERASHATIVTVDKYAKDEDQEAFWKALGGKIEPLATREEGGDDEQYEKDMMDHAKLYKVEVEDNGQTRLEVVLQPEKKLLMDMLVDTEIYVLDCGNEVYGWYGRDCSEIKRDALKDETKKLFKQETRAPWAQMFMVGQGGEPFLFRERFADWPDLSHQSAIKKMFRQHESLNVKKVYSNKFNVETMLLNLRPEDDVPCPDGEGTLKVWMVKDKRTKIEVPEEEFGHFYSGQCYIILYEYKKNNALRYIIWTWQGKDSNKLEQGYAVKFTEDLYRHYSRTLFIVQQMIFQNKETLQFLLAFQGLYIVYRGHKGDPLDKVAMYHLRGTDILPIHALQTKTVSASRLNSRDAFVVRNTDSKIQYVWYGKALGLDMDKIGWIDELANNMNEFDETRGLEIKLVVKILEGEEPAEFWEAVGGKKQYADDEFLSSPLLKMHLFHCTAAKTANAVFSANEIYEYYQEDLLSKDIFILDAFFELFVWVGSKSTEMKKRSALEIAAEYLTLLKERENRGIEMNTSVIEEGKEPMRFKALFHDWEDPVAPVTVTEAAATPSASAQTTATTESGTADQKPAASVTETLQVFYQKYPYEVLKTNAPKECDRSQLEVHLTDEEFEEVFKMNRAEFAKVPKWKQLLEKKKLGLF